MASRRSAARATRLEDALDDVAFGFAFPGGTAFSPWRPFAGLERAAAGLVRERDMDHV